MQRLLIVGVGGVGSFLAEALHKYEQSEQFNNLQITLADGDSVDLTNLTYQNFSDSDILENKASCLAERFNFLYIDRFLDIEKDKEMLNKFDCIISAIDGTKFRRNLFKFVSEKGMYWIDMRSTGRIINIYSKHKNNDLQTMLNTLPKNGKEHGSCQKAYELEAGIIQGGNRIVAEIGAQYVLNWYRGESYTNPARFAHNF